MPCTRLAFGENAFRWCAVATLAAGIVVAAAEPGFAQSAPPENFSSAEAAGRALFQAVERHDERTIIAILGADKELVTGGGDALDELERERFARKYREMHRVGPAPDGSIVLYIGAENWPFPVPLVTQNGAWHFDAEAGRWEVLARRIGQNELIAVDTCHTLAAVEKGDPGQREAEAFLARLRSEKAPQASAGYFFRILEEPVAQGRVPAQGSPAGAARGRAAFIAYPVTYRLSGVMTFIVGENNVVYEKDLGPDTSERAAAIASYAPDATWSVAME